MRSAAEFFFSGCSAEYSGIAACIEDNAIDFRLRKICRSRERRLQASSFSHKAFRGWAHWLNNARGEEAAASAAKDSRCAVAKRDGGDSRLRVSNFHDGCPSLIR